MLALFQLMNGTGMPTQWLILKPCARAGQAGGVLCAASGSYAHFPALGDSNPNNLLLAKRPQKVLLPSHSRFYFPFSIQPCGTAPAVGHSGMGFIVTFKGGLLTENPFWKRNSASLRGWLEMRSISARWQYVSPAPGASWVVLVGASTGPSLCCANMTSQGGKKAMNEHSWQ